MRDLRDPDTDTDYAYELTYTFTPTTSHSAATGQIEISFVTDTAKKSITDKLAWEELGETRDAPGADLREHWSNDGVTIAYHDPPWDSYKELAADLGELEYVSRARYEDQFTGGYMPPDPHVHLKIDPTKTGEVRTAIAEYYAPLTIKSVYGCHLTLTPVPSFN